MAHFLARQLLPVYFHQFTGTYHVGVLDDALDVGAFPPLLQDSQSLFSSTLIGVLYIPVVIHPDAVVVFPGLGDDVEDAFRPVARVAIHHQVQLTHHVDADGDEGQGDEELEAYPQPLPGGRKPLWD